MHEVLQNISETLNKNYPCRSEFINKLVRYVGSSDEAFPAVIYIHGRTGTGKTAIVKEFMKLCSEAQCFRALLLNCIEYYSPKLFLEAMLNGLLNSDENVRADSVRDFVANLRRIRVTADTCTNGYMIALDNAERLREMEANMLPVILQLQQLTGLNICVLLLSQLPFEKYLCRTGFGGSPIFLHLPQYTKAQTAKILSLDLPNIRKIIEARVLQENAADCSERVQRVDEVTPEFFSNYLNLFLTVFFKACRDLTELRITARKYFLVYIQPVLSGELRASNVSSLWRNISGQLCSALAQIYVRIDNIEQLENRADVKSLSTLSEQKFRARSQCAELPYYAKYLLIAGFLASHNSAKSDRRLFVKQQTRSKKRLQNINAQIKVSEKMSTALGPKPFTIDRLLAIFYAILDEKVGLTCNLLSQISTLVRLRMMCYASGENNIVEGSAKLQCTVSLEFILYVGKRVGFNVQQYLCDFM